MFRPLMKVKDYITKTDTYRCDVTLSKFFHNHYKFFLNYNNQLQSTINVWIYLSHFLYFQNLNFVFSFFRDTFLSVMGRRKVKKILYDKYVLMLKIRNDQVDNHFNDKFVPLCHVGYFIKGNGRKLTTRYIYCTFYTLKN